MAIGTAAVQTKTYNISFSPKIFNVKFLKGDTAFIQCNSAARYSVNYLADKYNPELPLLDINLLIPGNCEVESLSYTFTAQSYASGIVLNNGCDAAPIGEQIFIKSLTKSWYPQKTYTPTATLLSNINMGQYRLASLRISPFKYDAIKKQLFLCSFKVEVKFKSAPYLERGKNLLDQLQRKAVGNNAYNSAELSTLYVPLKKDAVLNTNFKNTINKYYIITADSLKDAFEPLVQWKTDKGCQTEIITIGHIDSCQEVSQDTGAYKIKHYLYLRYHDLFNTNPALRKIPENLYILLGGDVNIVPTAYVLTNTYSNVENQGDKWLPCDMYYSCLKNSSSWYNNQNYIIANKFLNQFSQDSIYVARCPARTKLDVSTFVNKILFYEKNPPANWGNKILFCGQLVHYPLFDSNPQNLEGYISDVDTLSHIIVNQEINPYWNGNVKYLFDSRTNIAEYMQDDEAGYGIGHISTRRVTKEIKDNYSFIHVYTHGSDSTWSIGDSSFPFTQSIADTIQSVYPKVILTEACHTNSFDKEEFTHHCLGEAFIRNPYSGVVAYIGNSRQGLSNVDSLNVHLAFSDVFSSNFIASLFHPETNSQAVYWSYGHLGKLIYIGKCMGLGMYNLSANDSIKRWLNIEINCLGDPEMQLFTSQPQSFPISSIWNEYLNGSFNISIDTHGIQDYSATVFEWFNGNKESTLYEHLPAVCSLDLAAVDSSMIVLHRQNFRPFYAKVYPDTYIQNKTINTAKTYSSYRIFAGNAVTDKYVHGNVVISNGKTKMLSQKFINLQHGFEVKLGAELILDGEQSIY